MTKIFSKNQKKALKNSSIDPSEEFQIGMQELLKRYYARMQYQNKNGRTYEYLKSKKCKAVGYIRISTSQHESLNREVQKEIIKKIAREKGYELIGYFEDLGSATPNRPGFNGMQRFLKENSDVKFILCSEISRLSRNQRLINKLKNYVNVPFSF